MVEVEFKDSFEKTFRKIKDKKFREKIIKQIDKVVENPLIGKPMMHSRKGTREVYVSHYRLSYIYFEKKILILFLDIYHKDQQ